VPLKWNYVAMKRTRRDDEQTSLRQVVASDLTLDEDGILAPVPRGRIGICDRVTCNFPYGILSWDVKDLRTTKLILRLIVASELTVPL